MQSVFIHVKTDNDIVRLVLDCLFLLNFSILYVKCIVNNCILDKIHGASRSQVSKLYTLQL